MGAGQSTATPAQKSHALHVLRVTPSSPASETSIEPFFDFIVGFDGGDAFYADSDIDATELERIVEKHEGKTLNLLVWNSKTRTTRGTSRVRGYIHRTNHATKLSCTNRALAGLGFGTTRVNPTG